MTDVTDAGGLYGFSKLKAGDLLGRDLRATTPTRYEFADHVDERGDRHSARPRTIPFEGTLLRTSGISGRVSVEGTGLDGVEVVLAGAAKATAMTSNGGQYAFAGLAEGTYVLSMMNPERERPMQLR